LEKQTSRFQMIHITRNFARITSKLLSLGEYSNVGGGRTSGLVTKIESGRGFRAFKRQGEIRKEIYRIAAQD